MANMTDGMENELLDGITGVAQYTTPATTYLALFTADPTDAGSVANEVSGGGYARISLNGEFSGASGGSISSSSDIEFPTATADWGTITHVGVMKSGTAGTDDMMVWMALDNPTEVNNGNIFKILSGDMTITAD